MVDPFFDRTPTKWNINDFTRNFLQNASEYPTYSTLTEAWTYSIDAITRDITQPKGRRDKAKFLRELWGMSRNTKASQHQLAKTAYESFAKSHPQPTTIIGLVNNVNVGGGVQNNFGDSSSGSATPDASRNKRGKSVQVISGSSEDERPKKKKKDREKKAKRGKREKTSSIDEDSQRELLRTFTAIHSRMVAEKKWILGSGRAVEDVIYDYASILDKQVVAHLFILDPEDELMKDLFSEAEWLEIVSHLESRQKTLRDIPRPDCLDWVPSDVNTTKQLREILFGSIPMQGPDEEWVHDVYRQFLFLLEHPNQPLTRANCENWLEICVIGPLVYRCLMSVEGIMFRSKEASSVATGRVKNEKRTETGEGNHLVASPRLDGIFTLISPDYEFGACEVGRSDKGPEGTKRIVDFRKLVITLRHMLLRLHKELNIIRADELQVVGFMCSGLTLQPLRMYSPNGYICILERDNILRIPADAHRLKDIPALLRSVWLLKKTMSDSVVIVRGSDSKNTS